ncbi:MAG TPA: GNAT family N-acetyltransferase [Solirubrobacteraceae bacterium]
MNAFSAAVALETAVATGAATECEPTPLGTALHSPGIPDAYMVNLLLADPLAAAAAGGAALVRLLDDVYAGSSHRRVWIPDALAGEALRDELVTAGFEPEETVVLVLAGEPPDVSGPAREVDPQAVRAVERAVLEDGGTAPGLTEQLLGLREAMCGAATVRYVVAEEASHATVYVRDGVAKVEDVGTRPGARRRGLARSVVALGTRLALDERADPVLILADANDWPKDFYGRLGYVEAGRWWAFTRTV